jgi:hypothetical protein
MVQEDSAMLIDYSAYATNFAPFFFCRTRFAENRDSLAYCSTHAGQQQVTKQDYALFPVQN